MTTRKELIEALKRDDERRDLISRLRQPAEPVSPGSAERAFAEQATDAFALGYYPQIKAGIKAPFSDKSYVELRDETNKALEAQRIAYPAESIAGNIAGMAAGMAIPASGPLRLLQLGKKAKDAGVLSKGLIKAGGTLSTKAAPSIKRGAAVGAGYGFLSDPGDVEGEYNPTQMASRLAGGAQGLMLGGALAPIQKVLSSGAKGADVSNRLKEYAAEKAFKAVGPYQKDVLRNQKRMKDIGRTLLDKKVVKTLPTSYEKLADRANTALEEVGGEFGRAIDDIGAAVNKLRDKMVGRNQIVDPKLADLLPKAGIDKARVVESLRKKLINELQDVPGTKADVRKYKNLISDFLEGDRFLDIAKAQKLKEKIGREINWKRLPDADIPTQEKFYRELYSNLRQGIEDAADAGAEILGGDFVKKFKKIKGDYGNLKEAAAIANTRAGREFANRFLSLSDYQSAQLGGMAGLMRSASRGDDLGGTLSNMIMGSAIAALSNKGFRRFGNQVQAQAAMKLAKVIEAQPELARRYAGAIQRALDMPPEKAIGALYRLTNEPEFYAVSSTPTLGGR